MTSTPIPVVSASRRNVLKGALGAAAVPLLAGPLAAQPVQPHQLRLWLEGDINLAWAHSLYLPPELAAGLPPGTVARLRVESPATSGHSAAARATMLLYVFIAPAGVPAGIAAPELAPVSRLHVLADCVLLSVAEYADPATRPAKNLVASGRCVANDIPSPFGLLTGRIAYVAFGFDWQSEGDDAATFKLVTAGAAGSHVAVAPTAAGEIGLGNAGERDVRGTG